MTPHHPRSLGRMLNFATGATNQLANAMLAGHDLALAQWVILSALWREDGLLVSELAQYSGSNLPAASRLIDRMERRGLVTRHADPHDRRAIRVRLTETARTKSSLVDFYEEVNARLLAGFSKRETDALFEMLERVAANAKAAQEGDGGAQVDP